MSGDRKNGNQFFFLRTFPSWIQLKGIITMSPVENCSQFDSPFMTYLSVNLLIESATGENFT